jgi:hypothetical protein
MKAKYVFLLLALLALSCEQPKWQISLAGEWQISLDPEAAFTGETITLPGSLQEQGYGDEVDVHTSWTGQIIDSAWYHAPEYAKYREKGNVKVPFWLNPVKHYTGPAWYQKEIVIPPHWKDKNIFLELERAHWESTLYIDGRELGRQDALSTPHRYALSDLEPGKHSLSLKVNNRVNIPVGLNAHSVSDHTQSNWNGLIGRLSLVAKPQLYIDEVQVYPDVTNKKAKVKISLKGQSKAGKATLSLQLQTLAGEAVGEAVSLEVNHPEEDTALEASVEAGEEVLLWSEHSPDLYRLKTSLLAAGETDERYTTFGFRQFEAVGTRFHLNGQPIFLRGTLECCIFPLTGYPSMDPAYWEKIYSACKAFGLNHVRFHSWCPPEVAFEVADRLGVYLQVECAAWASVGDGGPQDAWIYAESDRILKEYGNHPSFCMLVYGNEPAGKNQVAYLSELVAYWKGKDERRVYSSAAGWPFVANADYWSTAEPRIQAWGGGLHSLINAQPPRSDYDFAALIRPDMPTVSHEIGQWCVYPNFEEIQKYTGVLKAKNMEIFKETLAEHGLADKAADFLYASGKLQTLCYKADIEAALRTPGFAGFQLLDLHDFPGQGTALVGVLDAFWDTKGYVDAETYSMFCNETVPLLRFPKMTWLNNEQMRVPIEFAHFGKEPLKDATIIWMLTSPKGLVEGRIIHDLPLGNAIPVGYIDVPFQYIKEAQPVLVSVEIANTSIKNQWTIWVYPAEKAPVENPPSIVYGYDESVLERLERGESVLLISPKGSVLPEKGGDIAAGFSSIFWNTAWTRNQAPHTLGISCEPAHPAFASFPNEGYSDYQWWDIVADCDAMLLEDFPADFRPLVYLIDDWFKNRRLALLFEARVGKGKLMVCSSDIQTNLDARPAAAQFRQSLLEYMASDKFKPQQELQPEQIRGLWKYAQTERRF